MTYTLPASSTITTMIPNVGDSMNWFVMPIENEIIFAAGTGTFLSTASTTGGTDFSISSFGVGELTFVRASSTDVLILLDQYTN